MCNGMRFEAVAPRVDEEDDSTTKEEEDPTDHHHHGKNSNHGSKRSTTSNSTGCCMLGGDSRLGRSASIPSIRNGPNPNASSFNQLVNEDEESLLLLLEKEQDDEEEGTSTTKIAPQRRERTKSADCSPTTHHNDPFFLQELPDLRPSLSQAQFLDNFLHDSWQTDSFSTFNGDDEIFFSNFETEEKDDMKLSDDVGEKLYYYPPVQDLFDYVEKAFSLTEKRIPKRKVEDINHVHHDNATRILLPPSSSSTPAVKRMKIVRFDTAAAAAASTTSKPVATSPRHLSTSISTHVPIASSSTPPPPLRPASSATDTTNCGSFYVANSKLSPAGMPSALVLGGPEEICKARADFPSSTTTTTSSPPPPSIPAPSNKAMRDIFSINRCPPHHFDLPSNFNPLPRTTRLLGTSATPTACKDAKLKMSTVLNGNKKTIFSESTAHSLHCDSMDTFFHRNIFPTSRTPAAAENVGNINLQLSKNPDHTTERKLLCNLLKPSSRHLVSDFTNHVLDQMEFTTFTASDKRGNRSKTALGFPGLACRYCGGGGKGHHSRSFTSERRKSGRYFPASIRVLANQTTLLVMYNHLETCSAIPKHVKDSLLQSYTQHLENKHKVVRKRDGTRAAFFKALWELLHAQSNTSDSSANEELTISTNDQGKK